MKVLFVDAGNYCRSPAAEAIACVLAVDAGCSDLQFESAGLKDKHAGGPADPRTVQACEAAGYPLRNFLCRQITDVDFATHDLILAMDRGNLADLVARQPTGTGARIELLLGDEEIPDPYYGGDDGFSQMILLLESGLRRLLQVRSASS
jgi:protein-tyrosine phosphatase